MKTVLIIGLILVAGMVGYLARTPEESVPAEDSPSATTPVATVPTEEPPTEEPPVKEVSITSGKNIDLSGKGLTKVPESVFRETSATSLDLSHNKLGGALQAEVRHLENLEVLNLSDNNLTGVPAEVGQLSKLRVLDLSNNPITGLPYEIGNLKNLEVLDLRGTQYATSDLEIIKEGLPPTVDIRTD